MKFNLEEYFHPVPGSETENKIIIFARRHWVSFLGQLILSVFVLILPIIFFLTLYFTETNIFNGAAKNFLIISLSIYYLVAITFSFAAWISYYYDVYIVTEDTIVDISQQGFFSRKISQLSILRVQDVSSNIKGILPTLFAYGNVLVETAGESKETFLLEAVPNPQQFSAKVLELHNNLIEKEGRRHQVLEAEGTFPPGKIEPEPQPQPQQPQPQTPYQEQLQKEIEKQKQEQGEVNKDDLNKGGEIKF